MILIEWNGFSQGFGLDTWQNEFFLWLADKEVEHDELRVMGLNMSQAKQNEQEAYDEMIAMDEKLR